ncbi:MAG: molybdenum ABC transporter permease subunit [Cyclobacteriaceae bacterium]|nr:MAG: molybdenum ABC transporter permease subunit [Cyclobacteriaceae bacterium]
MDWSPIILTLKLATVTTLVLLVISIPISKWLAFGNSRIKPIIETLVSMPLVLPPTVLGFYLLLAFSPDSFVGQLLDDWFGIRLAFSFTGLVIASVVYSLPFMVHPIQSGLSGLPTSMMDASRVIGKSYLTTLLKVELPNIKPSILTGIVLSFAHTVGEFGVVLMIGGSIPDQTRVASIAIYDEVEALNYGTAHQYALVLILLAFLVLLVVYLVNGRYINRFWR